MTQHDDLARMRSEHGDWIWNRSDTHVFLGVPGTVEGLKTVIEPGNSFSPGAGSFGVSAWLFDHTTSVLHAPEAMGEAIWEHSWRFEEGFLPVLTWEFAAGALELTSRLFADGDAATSVVNDYLSLTVRNASAAPAEVSLFLVVRSFGPAGGPLRSLAPAQEGSDVFINGAPLLCPQQDDGRWGALSFEESGRDISLSLKEGTLPETSRVEDPSGWASGALEYRLSLDAGETRTLGFAFPVKAGEMMVRDIPRPPMAPVADAERRVLETWRGRLGIGLDVPDPSFREAFHCQLAHLYMFTVAGQPRISPVSYPLWWLRDGSYVVVALDRGGLGEFAGGACRCGAGRDAFGGFGPEADGPGESLWMLTEHYLLTRDEEYLKAVWADLDRKAELVIRMRHAQAPIKLAPENMVPRHGLAASADLLCLPARDGLIRGRMDWCEPVFWINGFASAGLERAARCADALGEASLARRWRGESEALREALRRIAPSEFGQNDRDVNSALWPTGWAMGSEEIVSDQFDEFWSRVRCPAGQHHPEPMWTYFEAGQAHNYLLLGHRGRAWVSIRHFLDHHVAPGLYTYSEGDGDENSFGHWQHVRGWDRIPCVTPHGWTAAELFLLLRDCMLHEKGDSLVLGAGVPAEWIDAGEPFGISDAPSHFGKVSWRFDPATARLDVSTERDVPGGIVASLPQEAGEVAVEIRPRR
jgi:hypothetical protein